MELLLVLLVISTMLAIVAPALRGFEASRQTADTAMQVAAMAHWSRSRAVVLGRPCRLTFDAGGRSCRLSVQKGASYVEVDDVSAPRLRVPGGVTVTLESTDRDEPATYVQFYPDGRSDVATIVVRGARGEEYTVSCATGSERFRVTAPWEGGR